MKRIQLLMIMMKMINLKVVLGVEVIRVEDQGLMLKKALVEVV